MYNRKVNTNYKMTIKCWTTTEASKNSSPETVDLGLNQASLGHFYPPDNCSMGATTFTAPWVSLATDE